MAFRLIPRDEAFYPLFDEVALITAESAARLRTLMSSLPVRESDVDEIVAAERRGDEIVKAVRQRIESSIVTPFDREDIQLLANALDDVLDEIRAAADLAHLHKVSTALAGVDELLVHLEKITALDVELMARLRSLRDIAVLADEIDAKESEADATYRRVTAELFSGRHDALDILRWNDVVAAVERAIDAVERASDVAMSIAVKHA